jgi:phosphate ABC transporter membrane protein 1, PhoT family (TC 3.A.1.7.1)
MENVAEVQKSLREIKTRGEFLERFLKISLGFWALFAGLIFPIFAGLILLYEARLAIEKFGFIHFLTHTNWDPVAEDFGAATMIFGTVVSTILAILIAAPVAIGIAIFITELAPSWFKPIVSTAVELLAAIPSIIYGLWGFFVLAPIMATKVEPWLQDKLGDVPLIGKLFQGTPTGVDVLTTSLVLSIMIIPFMAAVVRDAFNMVPPIMKGVRLRAWGYQVGGYKGSGNSLHRIGYSGRFNSVRRKGSGRNHGGTFLAGNRPEIPKSLLEPFTTITVALANQFTEADTDVYLSALYYVGLLLYLVSFTMLGIAKFMVLRLEKRWKA